MNLHRLDYKRFRSDYMVKKLSDKRIDEMVESVRATMAVEGMELPPLAESLGIRMLKGEITRKEGIELIKEKYQLN